MGDLVTRLRQMSEEGLTALFDEVMSSDKLRSRLGKAGQNLMENKHAFDRNVETVLDFVNIPSKKDVRDLKQRLDHLSGQLFNLNVKLDRLLAERGGLHEPPRSAPPSRRKKKTER